MAYDTNLADKVRAYLYEVKGLQPEEKRMFAGLAFLVNDKMCVNVSGNNLMCRFDPGLKEVVALRAGYLPMIMKGKELDGYCYVEPAGFKKQKDFEYWIDTCLDFNARAKPSKKK